MPLIEMLKKLTGLAGLKKREFRCFRQHNGGFSTRSYNFVVIRYSRVFVGRYKPRLPPPRPQLLPPPPPRLPPRPASAESRGSRGSKRTRPRCILFPRN